MYSTLQYFTVLPVPEHQEDAGDEEGGPDGEEVGEGHAVGEALPGAVQPPPPARRGGGAVVVAVPVQGGVAIVTVVQHRVREVALGGGARVRGEEPTWCTHICFTLMGAAWFRRQSGTTGNQKVAGSIPGSS